MVPVESLLLRPLGTLLGLPLLVCKRLAARCKERTEGSPSGLAAALVRDGTPGAPRPACSRGKAGREVRLEGVVEARVRALTVCRELHAVRALPCAMSSHCAEAGPPGAACSPEIF